MSQSEIFRSKSFTLKKKDTICSRTEIKKLYQESVTMRLNNYMLYLEISFHRKMIELISQQKHMNVIDLSKDLLKQCSMLVNIILYEISNYYQTINHA